MTKYPYEILSKPAEELPEDVNPELREVRAKFVFYEHFHRFDPDIVGAFFSYLFFSISHRQEHLSFVFHLIFLIYI